MLESLQRHDPALVSLTSGDGSVLLCPTLQARIFCTLGNRLVHRLDDQALAHPHPTEFNNLGGNSLWPAPEGGPFAFNYLPGSEEWVVQAAIGRTPAEVFDLDGRRAVMQKSIELQNRRGTRLSLLFRRDVSVLPVPENALDHGLRGLAYVVKDMLKPQRAYSTSDALLAAWSLEQFPGGNGVTAFGVTSSRDDSTSPLNFGFYGKPDTPPACGANGFTVRLGGRTRFQFGVRTSAAPRLLGALDAKREFLMLRFTPLQSGRYFNIADNDQPDGPWSAADLYSVFNGGDLDFFEMETIGSMATEQDTLGTCVLESATHVLEGSREALLAYLATDLKVDMEDL